MSFIKAKKFLLSRAGDTKLGRAQLLKAVGEDNARMVDALGVAVEKFSDKATADAIEKSTVKLAAKVALLWREGVVPVAASEPLRAPMIHAATTLIDALERRPGDILPAASSEALKACAVLLVDIIKPYMKEKSWRRVEELGAYYASESFLSFLFNNVALHKERDAVLCALHSYMSPYGGAGSRKRTQPCVVVGCELPRLAIRGAQYCLGHQALKYAAGPPARVDEFMFNTEHATMFKDFLVASRPECLVLLELAHSIDDFAANSNRAVLKTRAAKIFDKYLRASTAGHRYVSAPAELTAPLATMIDSDSSISNRTFDGVRAWVAGHLQALYETEFRDSPQFAEFAHDNLGYELPPIDPARAHMLENAGISMAEVLAPAAVGGGAAAASGAGAASSA